MRTGSTWRSNRPRSSRSKASTPRRSSFSTASFKAFSIHRERAALLPRCGCPRLSPRRGHRRVAPEPVPQPPHVAVAAVPARSAVVRSSLSAATLGGNDMAKTAHWEDTTRYALLDVEGGGKVVLSISAGGGGVVLDGPDAEVDAAIDELVAAGCPTVRSDAEMVELAKASRGSPAWAFAGSNEIGLWQDRWGAIWLRSAGHDSVAGAVHLSKYQAMGLAEKLMELAKASPE